MKEKLLQLVADRDLLLDSPLRMLEDPTEESKKNEEQIDKLAEEIVQFIRTNRAQLTVEDMIESLTMLGQAPSILYDDNGHFTIGGDGSQNLPTFDDDFETKETVFEGVWFVKPGGWKKTIREALDAYLDQEDT